VGKTYNVAVIRGDGIGPELIDAAFLVLDAVTAKFGFSISQTEVDGGASTYERTGKTLSPENFEVVRTADATLKGPVGLPHVRFADGTEAGLLGGVLRNGLDLYANLRPILQLPGVVSPLRVEPGSIDYVIVRENTEGLYAARGKGVGNRWAVADTLLVTRAGCERISRFAFEVALQRSGSPQDGIQRVTCVDKANVLRSMYFFREVFLEIATEYPGVEAECLYVDAAAQALVMQPGHFDVIVTENLFGDILSDLGGGTIGGISLCPSGNIGDNCAYFEPIHGSAPTIVGQKKANPLGQILASAMMLDYLGEREAGNEIRNAVAHALSIGAIRIDPLGVAIGGPEVAANAIVELL
jgi:3-isopropylmalate dehydrogenase